MPLTYSSPINLEVSTLGKVIIDILTPDNEEVLAEHVCKGKVRFRLTLPSSSYRIDFRILGCVNPYNDWTTTIDGGIYSIEGFPIVEETPITIEAKVKDIVQLEESSVVVKEIILLPPLDENLDLSSIVDCDIGDTFTLSISRDNYTDFLYRLTAIQEYTTDWIVANDGIVTIDASGLDNRVKVEAKYVRFITDIAEESSVKDIEVLAIPSDIYIRTPHPGTDLNTIEEHEFSADFIINDLYGQPEYSLNGGIDWLPYNGPFDIGGLFADSITVQLRQFIVGSGDQYITAEATYLATVPVPIITLDEPGKTDWYPGEEYGINVDWGRIDKSHIIAFRKEYKVDDNSWLEYGEGEAIPELNVLGDHTLSFRANGDFGTIIGPEVSINFNMVIPDPIVVEQNGSEATIHYEGDLYVSFDNGDNFDLLATKKEGIDETQFQVTEVGYYPDVVFKQIIEGSYESNIVISEDFYKYPEDPIITPEGLLTTTQELTVTASPMFDLVEYSLNGGSTFEHYVDPVVLPFGNYSVVIKGTINGIGDMPQYEVSNEKTLYVRPTKPTIVGIENGIYYGDRLSIVIEKDNPSYLVEYSFDNGATWQVYSNVIEITKEGEYNIIARCKSNSYTSAVTDPNYVRLVSMGSVDYTRDSLAVVVDKSIDIFKELLRDDSIIGSYIRNGDSPIKGYFTLAITPEYIDYIFKIFVRNFGKMSDGTKRGISTAENYFMVMTNLILTDVDEDNISKVTDRAIANKPSITLWVNGIKVPDNEVLLYCSQSATDVFVSKKFFNFDGEDKVIIEKREYSKTDYVQGYVANGGGLTSITIPLNSFESDDVDFGVNGNNFILYQNGKYVHNEFTSIINTGFSYKFQLTDPLDGQENIEVFLESDIKYRSQRIYTNKVEDVYFTIGDEYMDPIHGPIPKRSCVFFVDGKRVDNNEVEQVGRSTFRYTMPLTNRTVKATVLLLDTDMIDDTKNKVWSSGYYLYNMLGCEKITQLLEDPTSGSGVSERLDSIVDIPTLIHKDFGDNQGVIDQGILEKIPGYDNKINKMIEKDPVLLRTVLEKNNIRKRYFRVTKTNVDTSVSIAVLKGVEEGYKGLATIYVNGKYSTYVVSEKTPSGSVVVQIEPAHFVIGDNTIEVDEYIFDGRSHYTLVSESETHSLGDGIYAIDVENFHGGDLGDVALLQVHNSDENCVYLNDDNEGYKIIDLIDSNGDINHAFVVFDSNDLDKDVSGQPIMTNLYLYSKQTSFVNRVHIGVEESFEDIIKPTITGINKLPLLTREGSTIGFSSTGEVLIEDQDFIIKDPEKITNLANSGVIVIKNLPEGSYVDIIHLPIEQKVLANESEVLNNKYGIIHFSDINFPVSGKYLDIYVNGIKVLPGDIDILSDKTLKVNNVTIPMVELYVRTSFGVDLSELEAKYFDKYVPSSIETYFGEVFGVYDYTVLAHERKTDYLIADGEYESFYSGVDSVGQVPNPTDDTNRWEDRFDPLKYAYLMYLRSRKTKCILDPLHIFTEEEKTMLSLYTKGIFDYDLIFDPGELEYYNELIFDLDPENYIAHDKAKLNGFIIRLMIEKGYATDTFSEEFKDSEDANILYPWDLPESICSLDPIDGGEDIII